jgi:tetratricopeptide (TPR) repeat protein
VLQTDADRRQQLESELTRLGMAPEEVRRLLNADAHTAEPTQTFAAPLPHASAAPLPTPAPPKTPARPSMESLQSFAAELMAKKAAEQTQAIQTASQALQLPEFRDSTVQETIQSEALLREAHLLRRREKFTEAIAKCREALALVPRDAAALELLGDLLQGIAQIDSALAAYKRAVEADPKRATAERKYGDLLMRQQTWGTADPEAIPINPYVSVLLSLCLPGAGQLHNGETTKGAVLLLLFAVCIALLGWSPWGFAGGQKGGGLTNSQIGLMVFWGVLIIVAVLDAHLVAKKDRIR